jgi:hypothetical protein
MAQRRHYARKKGVRDKSRARRAEQGDTLRQYERHYRRLHRYPERYLAIVFRDRDAATLDDIAAQIRVLNDGVPEKSSTVERVLRGYIERCRGPPYLVEEAGKYKRAEHPANAS